MKVGEISDAMPCKPQKMKVVELVHAILTVYAAARLDEN
jgi:hypothetical protein